MSKLSSSRALRRYTAAPTRLRGVKTSVVEKTRITRPSAKQRIFALLILLSTIFYTYQQQTFVNAWITLAAYGDAATPQLQNIKVIGNDHLSYAQVVKLSAMQIGDNVLSLDLVSSQKNLENNGWIEKVQVRRIFPHEIQIIIKERTPQIIWCIMEKFYLLDRQGYKIEEISNPAQAPGLLVIYGEGANEGFTQVLDALYAVDLDSKVEKLIKISNRRWDVCLRNELKIKLPGSNIKAALQYLPQIMREQETKGSISYIDLRTTPNKIYIKHHNTKKTN